MTARRFAIAALLLFVTRPLSAHPGHDLGAYGAVHIVTSPYHLGLLAAVGILICWAARFISHRLGRRCAQITGAAILAGASLLWLVGI